MTLHYGTAQAAGVSAARVDRMKALAAGWVADGTTPALVILAARRGVIFLHEAYGALAPGPDASPLAKDTIYPLASVSKPITATALMCLVEDGLVGLKRPVAEYIPEFAEGEGKERILVRHLLTHTSGLRDKDASALAEAREGRLNLPPCPPNQHPALHEWLHLRYGMPIWKPPGAEMCYFNQGFALLGEIVRRVSGQSLEDFCRARIFAPLGMADTFFTVPEAVRGRVVRRPDGTPFDWWNGEMNMEWPGPAGGGYSTAMDMAAFGQMFLNGGAYGEARVLSPAAVAEMTRNQTRGAGREYMDEETPGGPYGLGWFIFGDDAASSAGSLRSARTFGHFGSGGVMVWVDSMYELVGAFFFAQMEHDIWPGDVFANAVTAAVER